MTFETNGMGGWSIPQGTKIPEETTVPDFSRAGADCTFGLRCRIGQYCRFGKRNRFDAETIVGDMALFEALAWFGDGCTLGSYCEFDMDAVGGYTFGAGCVLEDIQLDAVPRDLARRVLRHVWMHPESLYQDRWHCGTRHCVAGHLEIQAYGTTRPKYTAVLARHAWKVAHGNLPCPSFEPDATKEEIFEALIRAEKTCQ